MTDKIWYLVPAGKVIGYWDGNGEEKAQTCRVKGVYKNEMMDSKGQHMDCWLKIQVVDDKNKNNQVVLMVLTMVELYERLKVRIGG